MLDRLSAFRKPLVIALGVTLAVLVVAAATAFGLLKWWDMPPGGEPDAGGLIRRFPEPRLQVAPQANKRAQLTSPAQTSLPAALRLTDADGRLVTGSDLASTDRVLVLVPAWFRCRTLCGLTVHSAIDALFDTGLPTREWQLILFSFDPQDSHDDAAQFQMSQLNYATWSRPQAMAASGLPLRVLTGDATQTSLLARTLGLVWNEARNEAGDVALEHPTGLVIITPDGRISDRLPGIDFDASTLRTAIVRATQGHIGALADRLWLLCSPVDPVSHPRSAAVLAGARATALVTLGALLVAAAVARLRRTHAGLSARANR